MDRKRSGDWSSSETKPSRMATRTFLDLIKLPLFTGKTFYLSGKHSRRYLKGKDPIPLMLVKGKAFGEDYFCSVGGIQEWIS